MTIGIGLIGCGSVAQRIHLPTLKRLGGARVTALCTNNTDTLARVAEQYSIPSSFNHYEELLQDPNVDAVAICVPPQMHEAVGLAALQANKHVLMEKPLALSLAASERLVEAAESSTLMTMLGFHLRSHSLLREAREWIADGRLGTLEMIRSTFTSGIRWKDNLPPWRGSEQSGGGLLIESGVHYYDLWRFLSGGEVAEVFALKNSDQHEELSAGITARLNCGALASAVFCRGTADSLEIDLYGSAGRLRIPAYALDGLRFDPAQRKGVEKITPWLMSLPARAYRATHAAFKGGNYSNAYHQLWTSFLQSIETSVPAGADFADGLEATRVSLAASRSASTHLPVRVADIHDTASRL